MARSVILLDASVEDRVEELHRKMDSVLRLLSGGANTPQPEEPDWLTAQAFCERYSMGRTTLTRRLAEEPCRIETLDAGGKKKLYRWSRQHRKEENHAS